MINTIKKKCLFLWLDDKEFFAIESAKRGIEVAQVYRRVPAFMRMIRRGLIVLDLPLVSLWTSSWKEKILEYETVILHASKLIPPIINFIRKENPNVRIIVWYWNPIKKSIKLNRFDRQNCEIWSFDELDCSLYGLKYNTQYYFNNISLNATSIEHDVIFVGGDKGRIDSLIDIQDKLNRLGISNYFHITSTGTKNKKYRHIYKDRIPYRIILEYISKSNAILDYVSINQSGLTVRPLEALFFRKKLITNDISISTRDFYRKENIFILGKDHIGNLSEFLSKPYKIVEAEIVDNYDFDNWFKRFFEI